MSKNNVGKIISKYNNQYIEFIDIAEHIIYKSFLITGFKISNNGVIKSANKNNFVKIVIDGRGNLLFSSKSLNNIYTKLTDVIIAKDIS